jgi:hypothetical protein
MKRLISLTSAIAVTTLNIAASVPVSAQNSIEGPAKEFERPIGIDKIEAPIKGFERPNPGEVKINRTPINEKIESVQVDKSVIQLKKQKPTQFRAFEVKDPQTGKPIPASQILTLPNGKKVKAGEYYAQLNKLEREFNQIGYSLRQPAEEITIQSSTINKEELQKQQQLLQKTPEKIDRSIDIQKQLEPSEVLRSIQKGPIKEINPRLPGEIINPNQPQLDIKPQIPQIDPQINPDINPQLKQAKSNFKLAQAANGSRTYTRSWNKQVGRRSTFAAYLRGKLELKGSRTYTRASAEGSTGGYAFNRNFELARGTATVYAPVSGRGSVNAGLYVARQRVYNFQTGFANRFSKGDSFSRSLDFGVANIRFFVGPIPMKARFGVRGRAGFRYNMAASGASRLAYARLNPFVDSRAYGQGGADIVVGGAGVGANLLLLKNNLNAYALARVGFASGNRAYLQTYYSVYNDMEALSGKAYAYAYVYVPRFGIPPWRKKQWNWNIFDWTGFKQRGYLLRNSNRVYF